MRAAAFVLLLAFPALSGCLSFLDNDDADRSPVQPADIGYDPATIRVTGVVRHALNLTSFDGTNLAVVAYEPESSDLAPDGQPPRWGTVIFAHGWGFFKETYEGVGGASQTPVPEDGRVKYTANRLQSFAQNGLVAIAYDARGFGQSGGTSTIAGPAEMADLEAVRAWAQATFPSNGLFGVVGQSYGGGQALQAWVDNPRITTVVPQYGWVDLYDGLAPGNVPKAEWAALLGGVGVGGSRGRVSPILAGWYQNALTRSDLEAVEAEMDARSATGRLGGVTKPLFACQGMQETLFPQIDRVWQEAGGFTRAYVYTGGHGTQDDGCWARSLDWFRYFLGGHDTGVDAWPALVTVDAGGGRPVEYADFPASPPTGYYLDVPNLERQFPGKQNFTIQQRLFSNPLQEPSGAWDQLGLPNNEVSEDMRRRDPGGVFFETASLEGTEVLLGAPTLTLRLADPAGPVPFQVTAQLIEATAGGNSRILTRAAYAALDPGHLDNGTLELRFHWVKADLESGHTLLLKVSDNDSSWFLPLTQDYAVTFTGESQLHAPFFLG